MQLRGAGGPTATKRNTHRTHDHLSQRVPPASQVEEELIQMFSQERAPDRSQDLADIIGA